MAEITLEKLHALVEKMADYIMAEMPAVKEKLDHLTQIVIRHEHRLDALDEKTARLAQIDHNVYLLLEGMDAIVKEQDIHRAERAAVSKTLDVYNERIGTLELRVLGSRIRDEEEREEKSSTIKDKRGHV